MPARYYQNKRAQEIIIPTYEGHTVSVKPYQFVIDGLGTYYTSGMGLTEVTANEVVTARVAYAYMPDEPTGIVIGDPTHVNGEYAVGSFQISSIDVTSYFLLITSKTKTDAYEFMECAFAAQAGETEEIPNAVVLDVPGKTMTITLAWTETAPDTWACQTDAELLVHDLNADSAFSQHFIASLFPALPDPVVLTSDLSGNSFWISGGKTEIVNYVPAPSSGSGFCFNPSTQKLYVYDPSTGEWGIVGGVGAVVGIGGTSGQIQYNNEGVLGGIEGSLIEPSHVQIKQGDTTSYSVLDLYAGDDSGAYLTSRSDSAISAVKTDEVKAGAQCQSVEGNPISSAYAYTDKIVLESTDAPNELSTKITITPSTVKLEGIGLYADNAAALAGGLTTGCMYQTITGELRIVISAG